MMPAEDEVLSVMVHVGDTVVEGADKLIMLLLRIAEDMRQRRREQLSRDGRDPIAARVAKNVGDKLTANVSGMGTRGIVSPLLANPDGTNVSYTIAAGVLTKDDMDKLSKQFAIRNLQVGVIGDQTGALGKVAMKVQQVRGGKNGALGQIEFSVRREQVEQFQAALMSIVPNVLTDAEKCRVSEKEAPAPAQEGKDSSLAEKDENRIAPDSSERDAAAASAGAPSAQRKKKAFSDLPDVHDAAQVLEGREDLKGMCDALNGQGVKVATSRDHEGKVQISLAAPNDVEAFAGRISRAASALGISDKAIALPPIARDEDGRYADSFSFCGFEFERKLPYEDVWVAKAGEEGRTSIEVSVLRDGSSRYEISHNGELLTASPSGDEVKVLKKQPLEDAVYKAAAALDRLGRIDERSKAEGFVVMRGKALSATESKSAKSEAGSASASEAREKAKEVARSLSSKAAKPDKGQHEGPKR